MATRENSTENTAVPSGSFSIGANGFNASALQPGLHIVATPIGNLRDVTIRALETLAAADLIACEDTRHTAKLLDHYAIKTRCVSYHEHNAAARRPELLGRLAEGEAVALVSEAGTPLISDPGYKLVEEAVEAGFQVFPVPGASALLAGLVTAGLPTDSFFFAGFLPHKQGARRNRIGELVDVPGTLVFYEAPGRLAATLADLAGVLGNRPAAFARELTKRFETVERGSLSSLAASLADTPAPKGEIVVLVGPPDPGAEKADTADAAFSERLAGLVAEHGVSRAAQLLALETGLKRKDIYARALALQAGLDNDP